MDLDPQRRRAVRRARKAVAASGLQKPFEEESTILTDMLTDLRHWADYNGQDFADSLRASENHWQVEVNEGARS